MAINHVQLKALIDSEPSNSGKTDAQVLDWCNTPSEVRDRESVTTEEVFTECLREQAEWDALTGEQRQIVRDICTVYQGVPTQSGDPARDTLIAVLGTQTKAAVAAIIPETVSPAVNDGINEKVRMSDVEIARAL